MSKFRFKSLPVILATSIFSVLLVSVLFLNMKNLQSKMKVNDFQRTFKENWLGYVRGFEFQGYVPKIIYFNNHLYLNDFHNNQIVEMDTLGKILNRFPQETDNQLISEIRSWHIDESGIYIFDSDKNVFTHLDLNNSMTNQYKANQTIVRAGFLQSNLFLINTFDSVSMDSPDKFQLELMIIDIKNKSKKQLNYPLPDVKHSAMKLNGIFIANNDGRIFYVCLMAGLFYCVDHEGKFLYLAKTIDKTPLPKVLESNDGTSIRLDPLVSQVNVSASVDDEYLYILSNINFDNEINEKERTVDVYNVIDGEYEFSFKAPNYKGSKPGRIAVVPHGFYFRYGEDYINYYSIKKSHL